MAITSTRHADEERGAEREQRAEHEAAGPGREGRGEIGADHVERAVRQVDQVHDAEDQRQPGRQQEQQHAELHAVQALLDEKQSSWRVDRGYSQAPRQDERRQRALRRRRA